MPHPNAAILRPSGERFEIVPGETVLDAALRQGIRLDYGCRHGNCSTCKYRLIEGEVDFGSASPYSLPESEREEGYALLCCAKPLEDLEIEIRRRPDRRVKPIVPPSQRAAEVAAVEQVTDTLWTLRLRPDAPLTFYPGQFVELAHAELDVPWRSYSIATPPGASELGFVMKRVANGAFSGRLDRMRPGDPLRLRGPYGTSYLRDGAEPVLLCATGSGIAPILSILRGAAEAGDSRSFRFYYGARTPADLRVAEALASGKVPNDFTFTPVLSQADETWTGARGRVTGAIQAGIPDASRLDAYLCGAPDMCDTVGRLLEAKGLPENHLFYDRFYPAVE
jgi:NAD(P)H-flavin reductase/ferredoxin